MFERPTNPHFFTGMIAGILAVGFVLGVLVSAAVYALMVAGCV